MTKRGVREVTRGSNNAPLGPLSGQKEPGSRPGFDAVALLCADWKEAYAQGALYMRDPKTVSFATHLKTANGSAVELSIAENAQDGLPWFLSYVPIADRMKLRRDFETKAPSIDAHTQPAASTNAYTGARPATTSLPPLLERNLERMQETEDYLEGPIPQDLVEEFASLGEELSSFAWTSQRWTDTIIEYAKRDIDVTALLDRDWKFAFSNRIIRFYEGKVIFPVSVLRCDGEAPIEVSITRDRKMDRPGALPWRVCYVDNFAFQKVRAGRALTDWAYLGNIDSMIESLADYALDEKWGFEQDEDSKDYSILRSYLMYTFYRLQSEKKVLENSDKGIAAFNTGLVDPTYEAIYACFSPSSSGCPWRFEAFYKAGSKQWGKKLVASFDPLQRDVDHILLDNIDRLPEAFLAEELRGGSDALEALSRAVNADDDASKKAAYDELREAVEDNAKVKRRLINRLDDAIELAQKRVEWNFKTAVPAFYPTKNTMSLLLPLDLTENDRPDVALVVELMESGAYIGQTILTMQMAYNNARLISRPDSDWLNTSLQVPAC